jgi:hypothetical protein
MILWCQKKQKKAKLCGISESQLKKRRKNGNLFSAQSEGMFVLLLFQQEMTKGASEEDVYIMYYGARLSRKNSMPNLSKK